MTDMLQTWIDNLISFTGKSLEQVQASFLERVPMQKSLVDMDDALNTIMFAMSDLSAITSGTNFIVDGGFCAT
jgi:enoyl-[acyl-carrier-protein] reductase (NADH)